MKSFAVLLMGAGLVASQSISDSCKATFTGLLTSPDADCLNTPGIVGLAAAGSSSIVGPVDNWLTGLCGKPKCTNDSLAAIVNKVASGCTTDFESWGVNLKDTNAAITAVQKAYPVVREVVCLKDNSANKNCITEALEGVEKASGAPLTFKNFGDTVTKLFSSGSGIPKEITCNNCTKMGYNILKRASLITPDVTTTYTNQCGASFVDEQNPSGIVQLASTATSSSNSVMATTPLFTGGTFATLAASMLTALLSGFALLA
jgi:hypothetical protein